MSWFQEMKPYFLVARFYGLAPYSFATDTPLESSILLFYSFIIIAIRVMNTSFRFYLHLLEDVEISTKLLSIFETLLHGIVVITESIVAIRCLDELKSAIVHVEEFDRIMRVNFATTSLALKSWLIISLPGLFFAFYFSQRNQWTWEDGYQLYLMFWGFGWFAMVLKFAAIMHSLNRRFLHLCDQITKGSAFIADDATVSTRPLRLADVRRLHEHLMSAAKTFNRLHNMALLMWIFESSLYATVKLHVCLAYPIAPEIHKQIWHIFIETTPDFAILIYLFVSCHNAAVVANKVGWKSLSPDSCVLRGRFVHERDEGFAIGQYFLHNPLVFNAGYGIIQVELPSLGTIFGAMTTALVILSAQ